MITPKDARKLANAAPAQKAAEQVDRIVHEMEIAVQLNAKSGTLGGRVWVGPTGHADDTNERAAVLVEAARRLEAAGWAVSMKSGWMMVSVPPESDN